MKCPECDVVLPDEDLLAQSAHMTSYHPEVIEQRRAESRRWDGWEDG